MVYYKVSQHYVDKYDLSFDRNVLEKIKNNLIKNCSKKTHVIKESTLEEDQLIKDSSSEKIIKVKKTDTGKIRSYSDTSEDKKVYKYDYIHITYPNLVILINRLLNEDESSIDDIINYEIENLLDYNELLKKQKNKVKQSVDASPDELSKELEILHKLEDDKELNKGIKTTRYYYEKLLGSINYKQLDQIPIIDVIEYKEFFSFQDKTYDYDIKNKKIIKIGNKK